MMKSLFSFFFVAMAAVTANGATLSGKVTDMESGAVLAGVEVKVLDTQQKWSRTGGTGPNGIYEITMLPDNAAVIIEYRKISYQIYPTKRSTALNKGNTVVDVGLTFETDDRAYYSRLAEKLSNMNGKSRAEALAAIHALGANQRTMAFEELEKVGVNPEPSNRNERNDSETPSTTQKKNTKTAEDPPPGD